MRYVAAAILVAIAVGAGPNDVILSERSERRISPWPLPFAARRVWSTRLA
ncbi:MAG: hypothetical protein U9R68_01335 [Planctomycetota bacterium]|nr:hypothetical protein [Planctomycetota bacterium]